MRALIWVVAGTALLITSSVASAASQEQKSSSLRGSWSATVGTRPALQGTWTAQLQSTGPNRATGTWTLVDTGGRIVARGTWAATRAAGSWTGTWSARTSAGATRSGAWRADVEGGPSTFADLLRSTVQKQLTGAWNSAGLHGAWALSANPRDTNSRGASGARKLKHGFGS